MPIDIIIYAIIAAGLFFWLKNILGETHGEEQRQRPNPFDEMQKRLDEQANRKEEEMRLTDVADSPELAAAEYDAHVTPKSNVEALDPDILEQINDKGIEKELFKISRADRGFSLKEFMENAEDAFVMIINAYSEGDRATLEDMLSQQVYEPFIEAIEDRESRGETVDVDVHAVKDTTVRKAWMEGHMAYIALRFVANETAVIRNKDGDILSGNPDVVTEKIDVWTFGRNTKTNDPRWFLYETDMDDGVSYQDEHKLAREQGDQA